MGTWVLEAPSSKNWSQVQVLPKRGAGRAGVGTATPGETSKRNRRNTCRLSSNLLVSPGGKAYVGRHAARRQS